MNTLRPMLVIGTRPEGIKMAPIVRECRRLRDRIEPIVCFTGQHREMLAQVAEYFGIAPDVDLQLMQPSQTLSTLTARCVEALDATVIRYGPDHIVAQGDTTTVMAAAMCAFYRRVSFVHVEAGLRTGNLRSPWPEEFNRRIASLTASMHCAPTHLAATNVLAEGADPRTVHVTGNPVVDALLWTVAHERRRTDQWQQKYHFLGDRRTVLITAHRRENFGQRLVAICRAIGTLARRFGDVEFLYPVHLNPSVRQIVYAHLSNFANVHLTAPASYPEFVWLMDRSTLILTDSGGVQEEAPSLRKPVLVLRDTTERPEAIEAHASRLVGTSERQIVQSAAKLLTDPAHYAKHQAHRNPYGDGHAAQRIVELMLTHAGFHSRRVRAAA